MARPCTRFITDLSVDDLEFLLGTWRSHKHHIVRWWAHAIILSSQKVSVPELTKVFGIDDDTARSLLTRWEQHGRDGLEDDFRPGGPPKLDEAGRKLVIDLLHEHTNNPNVVIEQVKKRTGKLISRRSLRRWARQAGMRWKRFRKSLKKLRNPELFAIAPEWEMKGLILYPLPPYSPELNEIEHRWKHIKTSELPAAAWKNLSSSAGKLTEVSTTLGRFVLMPSLASG